MAEVYKIVIADDEALICMDLKEMMEEAGHEVVGVGSDGVEALELTKKLNPKFNGITIKCIFLLVPKCLIVVLQLKN